jgi:hypothetical protein
MDSDLTHPRLNDVHSQPDAVSKCRYPFCGSGGRAVSAIRADQSGRTFSASAHMSYTRCPPPGVPIQHLVARVCQRIRRDRGGAGARECDAPHADRRDFRPVEERKVGDVGEMHALKLEMGEMERDGER